MPSFRVWDEINESEESADRVEASTARGAAISYAQLDVDGGIDGLYTKHGQPMVDVSKGHPISVRDAEGMLHRFRVAIVEYEPVFDAVRLSQEPQSQLCLLGPDDYTEAREEGRELIKALDKATRGMEGP